MEHEKFVSEQSGSGTAREETLCKLAAAFDSFKELRNNLKEGAKFYNDLTQVSYNGTSYLIYNLIFEFQVQLRNIIVII